MELIFKNIKQLITPQFLKEVSDKLIIDEAVCIKLSDAIMAGLFGALLTKGDNSQTEEILKGFVSEVNDDREVGICSLDDLDSKRIDAAITLGDAVFVAKREEYISFIAESIFVNKEQIERLVTVLTYTFGLYLGRKLITKEYTITGLLGQIHAERNFFLGYISSGDISVLGLPSLLTIGQNLSSDAKVVSDAVYYDIMHGSTPVKEKKHSWWRWFSFKAAL